MLQVWSFLFPPAGVNSDLTRAVCSFAINEFIHLLLDYKPPDRVGYGQSATRIQDNN